MSCEELFAESFSVFAFAQTDNKQQADVEERGEGSSFVKMPALFKKIILSRIRFMVSVE